MYAPVRSSRAQVGRKKGGKRRTTAPRDNIIIVLTGNRHDDHFCVNVDGKPALLPYASFAALVDLICARVQSNSGFLGSARSTIYRLRKAFDLHAGAGKRLIETGSGEEYRLTILKSELWRCVGVTPCFFDLVARNLFSKEQADILRKHCRRCTLPEADRSPSGD